MEIFDAEAAKAGRPFPVAGRQFVDRDTFVSSVEIMPNSEDQRVRAEQQFLDVPRWWEEMAPGGLYYLRRRVQHGIDLVVRSAQCAAAPLVACCTHYYRQDPLKEVWVERAGSPSKRIRDED